MMHRLQHAVSFLSRWAQLQLKSPFSTAATLLSTLTTMAECNSAHPDLCTVDY